MLKTRPARAARLFVLFKPITLGPFIREKRSRGLHKTRTPRYRRSRLTSSAASSPCGLILANEFGAVLILAAAYFGRESVRINVLKHCLRLAQAVNGSCACTCFVIIAQTSFLLPSIRLRKMASASNESLITKEKDSAKKRISGVPREKNGYSLFVVLSNLIIASLQPVQVLGHTASVRFRLYWIDAGLHVEL